MSESNDSQDLAAACPITLRCAALQSLANAAAPVDAEFRTLRALCLPQPHAEAILRGLTRLEYRPRPTAFRGRFLLYASGRRFRLEEEADMLERYGLTDVAAENLPRGVLVGTAELWNCTGSAGRYVWHLRQAERLPTPLTPPNHSASQWFAPF